MPRLSLPCVVLATSLLAACAGPQVAGVAPALLAQDVLVADETSGQVRGSVSALAMDPADGGALVDLRARSVIGDDAFHAAEEEIDLLELTASSRIRPSVEGDALATREPREPR